MAEDAFAPLTLRSPDGALASVCRHGAHVLSWQPRDATRGLLYLSGRSVAAPGAAIRGGIPVIFPQFSGFGPLPKHGSARNRAWASLAQTDPARASFTLRDDAATRALWPHEFAAQLSVALGNATLTTLLEVTNTGALPFRFTAAMHTYLAVEDIAATRLGGVRDCPYLDATEGMRPGTETRKWVRFDGEFDRVFVAPPGDLLVDDGHARIAIERAGYADVVVWNPGEEKAAALSDLDAGGGRRFLCVEPAVFDPPVTLAAGQTWRGEQVLRHLPR